MKHNAISFLIISLFLLLLAGCAGQQRRFVIGVSQCSDDEWRAQMNKEISREALFYPEAEVVFRTAKDNNEQQIHDIELMIRNRVDLLVVSPNEAEVLAPVIEKAYGRGIPVILTDRKIPQDSFGQLYGLHRCRQLRHRAQRGRIYRCAPARGRQGGRGNGASRLDSGGGTASGDDGGAGEMSRHRSRGFGRCGLAAQGGARAFRLDSCRSSGH